MAARLITVAFSHFCEKARWALDHHGVDYVEECHLPALAWAATYRAGGGRTVPVLVLDGAVLADSSDILRHLDALAPPARRLYPADPRLRAECDSLEERFDEVLGPEVRRIGYAHALADRGLILDLARHGPPRWQWETFRAVLPLARLMIERGTGTTPATVAAAHDVVRRIFDDVAGRLADGRRYLVGDRFSAADLTFASLGAAMVLPPEHPFPWPAERFPPSLHATWRELRAHPAGAFLMRVYAEHRGPSRAAAQLSASGSSTGGAAAPEPLRARSGSST